MLDIPTSWIGRPSPMSTGKRAGRQYHAPWPMPARRIATAFEVVERVADEGTYLPEGHLLVGTLCLERLSRRAARYASGEGRLAPAG